MCYILAIEYGSSFIPIIDSCAGGMEQWMSGMGETLTQQDLIAARVKFIEGQIEGFKVSIQKYNCNHSALCIRTL